MGGGEIFVIIVAILIVFGTKRIPEMAQYLGKGLREIKKATDDIKKEILDTEISNDIKDIKKEILDTDISKDIKDINNQLKG